MYILYKSYAIIKNVIRVIAESDSIAEKNQEGPRVITKDWKGL